MDNMTDTIFDESFVISARGFNIQAYKTVIINQENRSLAPVFVLHHGAGLSAYSWAPIIKLAKKSLLFPDGTTFLCFDAIGHGNTKQIVKSKSVDDTDVCSVDFFVSCFIDVLKEFSEKCDKTLDTLLSRAVFVGHSLGGSIVTRAVPLLEKPPFALVLVDTVEETATKALSNLPFFLSSRPKSFASLYDAVDWAFRSNFMKNMDSIKITLPYLLEEKQSSGSNDSIFVWKTDLIVYKYHWHSWFEQLDKLFVSSPTYRLLILADTDRLDTALTIGQMQGKFQLEIIRNSGHLVAEDAPDQVLQILSKFWNRINRPIIKPKPSASI